MTVGSTIIICDNTLTMVSVNLRFQTSSEDSFFLLLLAYQRIRGFAFMRYINPRFIDCVNGNSTTLLTMSFFENNNSHGSDVTKIVRPNVHGNCYTCYDTLQHICHQ